MPRASASQALRWKSFFLKKGFDIDYKRMSGGYVGQVKDVGYGLEFSFAINLKMFYVYFTTGKT